MPGGDGAVLTAKKSLIMDQTRTVDWASTGPFQPEMATLSGREVLERVKAGRFAPPPMARVIGFDLEMLGEGEVVLVMEPREDLENLAGALHGGVAATLLDNVFGAAVTTLLPAGARSATLNLNVSYLRAITLRSGTIRARARVTRLARAAAFVEGAMTDAQGRCAPKASPPSRSAILLQADPRKDVYWCAPTRW
jgi:uncharacterized protein (TIGR00369 family)